MQQPYKAVILSIAKDLSFSDKKILQSLCSFRMTSVLILSALLLLNGCSRISNMFDSEDPPLPGERISVLELQQSLEPDDPQLAAEGLVTPAPWKNEFWPQAGGYPNHSMQNLALNTGALKEVWEADIGEGSTDELPLTAQPVVVDGKIFTLDTDSKLSAFDIRSGKKIWNTDVRDPKEDDPVISGGIAFSGGVLYVTSGYNELLAVRPADGQFFWRKKIPAPSRAAPTIMDGRVFVVTLDNRLLALNAADGSLLWEYSGLGETATLVGAASPAASREIVVPVFSSGEITGLRVENGSVAWSDNLSNVRSAGGLESLADIKALPVFDKGLIVAISFSGRIAAIDERSGTRVWQREISGSNTPWMAGNHLFLLSSDNQLIALSRETGGIRWVTKLARFADEDKDEPLHWTGPILAGGRLLSFSGNGLVVEAEPVTGKILRQWKSGQNVEITPIIAGGTLYVLGHDGTLTAYK
jgi:outer membrane protein assembly factor BamB